MLFFDHLSRLLVLNALVRSVVVVLHFPEPELIFSIFRILEANEVKQVFIFGSIGAFNEAIVPEFTLFRPCWRPRHKCTEYWISAAKQCFHSRVSDHSLPFLTHFRYKWPPPEGASALRCQHSVQLWRPRQQEAVERAIRLGQSLVVK